MTMPSTITTGSGKIYYLTKYRGKALPPANKHGIATGTKLYEYWIGPDDDSARLHAENATTYFLD